MGASRHRKIVGLLVLLTLAAALVPIAGAAGAGDTRHLSLDPTFGHHGRVLAVPPQETEPTAFTAATRESNGDYLLEVRRHPVSGPPVRELELRHPNGELDSAFGKGGRRTVGRGKGLLALPDGNTLVGVEGCGGKLSSVMMIGPDGAPAASFGRNGCGASVLETRRLAVDPAGDIFVAGTRQYCPPCGKSTQPGQEVVIAKLLPDGELDRSYGRNGTVGTNAELHLEGLSFFSQLSPEGIVATADGGVVVSTGTGVYRLDPNGALDTSFAAGGVFKLAKGNAGPLVLQPDGRIDLVSTDSEDALFVTALGPHGELDPGFGVGGTAQIPAPSGSSQYELVAAAAPAGAVVVGAREPFPRPCVQPCTTATFLARLTAAGQPDPTYGAGGVATIGASPPGLASQDHVSAVLIAPDGSTLTVGADWEENALATAQTVTGALDPALGGDGTLSERRHRPAQLAPVGLVANQRGGLTVMNARAGARGLLVGYLLDFDRDGKRLRAPGGSPAPKTHLNGDLIPVAGGFLIRDEDEAKREHVIPAIGPAGEPLAGFGNHGTVELPARFDPHAVERAPDGGAVLVGSTGERAMAVYRLGPDGKPMRGFGHEGLAFALRHKYAVAKGALVEADGDTVVTGWAGSQAVVARLRPDGKLDRAYAKRGLARGLFKPESSGETITRRPGGGVLVAALRESRDHHRSLLLTRLDNDGHKMRDFGHRGVLRVGTEVRPLAVLATGRRIVVVTTPLTTVGIYHRGVELRAFLPDGAVDRGFGDDGTVLYGSGNGRRPFFQPGAAVAQSGGRIVVAGTNEYGDRRTKAELVRFRVP